MPTTGDDGRIHPMAVFAAIRDVAEPDYIGIADGGDFLSFARIGLDTDIYLDAGAFGCLGTGVPFANAAALAHPGRQVMDTREYGTRPGFGLPRASMTRPGPQGGVPGTCGSPRSPISARDGEVNGPLDPRPHGASLEGWRWVGGLRPITWKGLDDDRQGKGRHGSGRR